MKGLGPKAYEQAVGFLRIREGKEPLDATGIHPDHYAATLSFLEGELGIKKKNLILPLQDLKNYSEQEIEGFASKYGL